VNPAFEALTGYSRQEACGKTPRILKSGEQGPEIYQDLWSTILAGNVFRGILVNRKKNGDLYYVEESICPVRDGGGQVTHFIANGRDLTDRSASRPNCCRRRKWMPSGDWPEASLTISTTCSPSLPAIRNLPWTQLHRTDRSPARFKKSYWQHEGPRS
jgi:PAS domain S-box-containing protein